MNTPRDTRGEKPSLPALGGSRDSGDDKRLTWDRVGEREGARKGPRPFLAPSQNLFPTTNHQPDQP